MKKVKQIRTTRDIKKFEKEVAKAPRREDDPNSYASNFARAIEKTDAIEIVLTKFQSALSSKAGATRKMKKYYSKEAAYLQRRIERNRKARESLQKMLRIRVSK